MYERAVSGEVARQRPRRSELLARELLKVREMLAKTRGSELADRTFAEEKVEDEAEVGEKCGDEKGSTERECVDYHRVSKYNDGW